MTPSPMVASHMHPNQQYQQQPHPGYANQNNPHYRLRMAIQHIHTNLEREPRVICEGLQPVKPESIQERNARRKRILREIMKRDAPHLLDPSVPPPDDSEENEVNTLAESVQEMIGNSTVEKDVKFELFDSASTDVEMEDVNGGPAQSEDKPLDLSNAGEFKVPKIEKKEPLIVDPGVLAFPEVMRASFVNSKYRTLDPGHQGPELVSIRSLCTPRRRPVTYAEVFKKHPIKPPPLEPFSNKIDTAQLEFIAEIYRQSNYMSAPLLTRHPLSQRYLRAVSRAFRDDIYCYKSLPQLDPMYSESDSNLPNLERILSRERESRISQNKPLMMPPLVPPQNQLQMPQGPPAHIPQAPISQMQQQLPPVMASGAVVVKMKEPEVETPTPSSTESSTPALMDGLPPPPPPEKKYVCNVPGCTKSYKNLQGLKNHTTKTHPGMPVPSRLSHSEESTPVPSNRPPSKASSVASRTTTPPAQPIPVNGPQPVAQYSQPLPIQQQQARLPAPPPPSMPVFTPTQAPQPRQPEPSSSRSSLGSTAMEVDTSASNESTMSQTSMDQRMMQNIPVVTPIVSQASQPPAPPVPKIKCSYCSKSYKTSANLSRHMREVHATIYDANGQHQPMASQPVSQTFYTTQQGQMLVEQNDSDAGSRSTGQPVTIMRQVPHHTSQMVTLDHQGQPGQMMQMHYQVQPMQQQQQQPQQQRQQQQQPMEVDGQNFSQSQGSNPGNSDEVMVVESSPPRTPGRSAGSESQSGTPVLLQQSGLVRQNPGGNQILRQVTAQGRVHFMPQQVHIIQGNGPTQVVMPPGSRSDQVTVLVRSQNGGMRPMTTGQLARSSNQIVTSQPTYVYQHQVSQSGPSGTTTRYIINTPATSRATGTPGPGRNTPSTSTGPQAHNDSSSNSDEFYPSPPQLTPQQPTPTRHPGQQGSGRTGGQVFSRRVPAGTAGVRITQGATPAGVQRSGQVRYAVQVPQGSTQGGSSGGNQTYVQGNAIPGNVQYMRSANGTQIPGGGAVRFITAASSSNVMRVQGQRPVQQYTVASGQQRNFATRPTARMRIAVPVIQGQGQVRRPRPNPAQQPPQMQHQQQQPAQQQQQPQQQNVQQMPPPSQQPPPPPMQSQSAESAPQQSQSQAQ